MYASHLSATVTDAVYAEAFTTVPFINRTRLVPFSLSRTQRSGFPSSFKSPGTGPLAEEDVVDEDDVDEEDEDDEACEDDFPPAPASPPVRPGATFSKPPSWQAASSATPRSHDHGDLPAER
jgi:hypothetical protein